MLSVPLSAKGVRAALAVVLAVMAMVATARAGECAAGEKDYLGDLEQMVREGPPYRYREAFWCLSRRCLPEDWRRWAGPLAARQFADCRTSLYRDRIAAACLPLLADSSESRDEFSPRGAAAALAAGYGFSNLGSHDLFEIVTDAIRVGSHPPDSRFALLAIMQDPRTMAFLRAYHASLAGRSSPERDGPLRDILNCLYHVPGDSALVLAREIARSELTADLKERARRVLDR
ncbi:MAG: hypothetical protein IPK72_24780 [Candidatus Eisenbacteria bacterium]|nr:hypothetical protein [Candidatus Eisenbacteria bacterium]